MKENSKNNSCQKFSSAALKGEVMKRLINRSFAAITVLSLLTLGLMLAGCGGSSGGVSTEVVSGTAAVGKTALAKADAGSTPAGQVSLKDSASPAEIRTSGIGSDGTFAINVTGMKAPYVLQAKGSANGSPYTLHSFAEGPGTANINPLSDAIVACAAGDDEPKDVYEKSDADKNHKIKRNLARAVSTLLTKLQPLLIHYSAEHTNPITSRYIANHLELDDLFNHVKIEVIAGILTITNEKTEAVIFSGKLSDIANGIFDGGAMPPTAAVPAAPAGLTAVGGSGQVTLSWTSVSNATAYNVYYATTPGVTAANGTRLASAANPYVQNGLTAGTTYYYVVTAVNSSGESAASAQASAATAATPPVPTVPAMPTNVIASGGTNQVSISWAPVSTATAYNLYYATTSGVTKANGTKISGVTSPAVQPNLAADTTYYYIVTAVNTAGESAASLQVAATTLATVPSPTAPAAPTGVTAFGGDTRATISWPAVAGASAYNVYWATTSGVTKTSGTKISGVTSPYIKTGLAAGTAHYFIVTAANSVGESAASNQAAATTNAALPTLPAAPTGVTASGGANQVSISWATVPGATSYNIFWATTAGVTTAGTKITTAASPYVQTGLAASTSYYYIVTAVNASGQSVASTQVTAATNAPAVTIPAVPTAVTAAGGANQVNISWGAVSGATSYNIYYATTTGVTKNSGARITNAASPYLQTGLAASTTYYYVVTAQNSAGEGAASAQTSAATNAPPAMTCTGCHAIPPAAGQHSFHSFTSCLTCHGSGYSSTTANPATHMNGSIDVGGSSGWNSTSRSCSNSCHGSRAW